MRNWNYKAGLLIFLLCYKILFGPSFHNLLDYVPISNVRMLCNDNLRKFYCIAMSNNKDSSNDDLCYLGAV